MKTTILLLSLFIATSTFAQDGIGENFRKVSGKQQWDFMQLHFNYYGCIKYAVFMTLRNSEVMTDEKQE